MRRSRFTLFACVLAPSLAWAQTSPESVTVSGTKSREMLQGFVHSFAAPTRMTGKMARWGSGICPVTVGLPAGFAKFITQGLKEIASQVGAPVNARTGCTPNIAIVFTTVPQKLVDDIARKKPGLLGYYDNSDQLKKLATVTHPIQAWYMTASRDVRGKLLVDGARTVGTGLEISYECPPPMVGICSLHLSDAQAMDVTGSRLGDGVRSELYNVIIIADRGKLVNYAMGSLSDYIAMLALTQIMSLDSCQQLSSIVNMLAEGCARKAEALTQNDKAYLHGLYKAAPDQTLGTQQDQISYQMEQELTGH